MRRKSYVLILSMILLVVLAGCSFPWKKKKAAVSPNINQMATTTVTGATSTPDSFGSIKKFKDTEELQTFLVQHADAGSATDSQLADLATTETAASSTDSQSDQTILATAANYSRTNIQTAASAEAGIIKTDGKYVYLLDYNNLYIIKATPASEAIIKTKITFKSRPQAFYISGDRLIVFGYDNQIYTDKTYQSFRRQGSYTYLKIFDISDVTNPKQIRDLDLEGHYRDLRLVGDYLYFITANHQNYQLGEPLLPRVLDGGQVLPETCSLSAKCYSPDVFYFNVPYKNFDFTSVMTVDLKNAPTEPTGNVYLMSSDQEMYVSPNNIYLTYTQKLDESEVEREVTTSLVKPHLLTDDQNKITKIQSIDNFILSDEEKQAKIYNIVQAYISSLTDSEAADLQTEIDALLNKTLTERAKELEKTVIHKIAFNGAKLEYKTSGQVPGYLLSQSSMDENNNYFRIATKRGQSWSNLVVADKDSYNNIYILDDKLIPIGALENLAGGGLFTGASFIGNRAYLIPQTAGSLLAIDLRDPKLPKALGTLKFPVYSTYLRLYGDNLILGFGRDSETSPAGVVTNKGLKLSLFDITSISAPRELDTFSFGDQYSDSVALADSQALLISSDKNLLVIPATLRSGAGAKLEFSGALVFDITGNKLKLSGRIDHSDGGNYINRDFWNGVGYYDNSVKRSLFIDDALFTFSNKFLKINNLKAVNNALPLFKSIDLLPNVGKTSEVVKPVTATTTPVAVSSKGTSTKAVVTPKNTTK